MKVWIYVEGESDCIALNKLWARWRGAMRTSGWGIQITALENKSKYFRKIGHRAAEKLMDNDQDAVVGLPDLYPSREYANTQYRHDNLAELRAVQNTLVCKALETIHNLSQPQCRAAISRFFPAALKHDLEMLLLAAREELGTVLGGSLGNWRHPVEDQNQTKPPKRIVEELFMAKLHRKYRDTRDAGAVLDRVTSLSAIIHGESGQLECPVFKETMDWIASKTGVPAY